MIEFIERCNNLIEDKNYTSSNNVLSFNKLKNQFSKNKNWVEAESNLSDFDLQKFFYSSLFKPDDETKTDCIDLNRLTIFAHYSCKQNKETVNYGKILHIQEQSCTDENHPNDLLSH